jgi:2-dehydro-3-deoxyphosphogluconate aldolase/(4S)-4-hydroxy-2-oxoglutarate aldolase
VTTIRSDAGPRSKEQVLAAIHEAFVVPVVRVNDSEEALCAAEGMVLAGHPILELTLTVPNALATIEEMTRRFGRSLIVGAGTVLNSEDCEAAIHSGAQFIVSPSTSAQVIKLARSRGVVCMPGAFTPTEVLTAWEAGADVVKIFPADAVGGPRYIRSLLAPFPKIRYVPSGGVDMRNIGEYFSAGAHAVAIGGLIFEQKALKKRRVDVIAANIQRFTAAIRSSSDLQAE